MNLKIYLSCCYRHKVGQKQHIFPLGVNLSDPIIILHNFDNKWRHLSVLKELGHIKIQDFTFLKKT